MRHLWRINISMLYDTDITEGERRKAERVINAHRKAAKDAELYARSMIFKVEQQQVSSCFNSIFQIWIF